MSALSAWLNGVLWGSALAGVIWLTLRLTPRRALPASGRYWIWWATLAAALALPFAGHSPGSRAGSLVLIEVPRAPVPPIERIPVPPQSTARDGHRLTIATGWWIEAATVAWGALAAILLLRLVLSFAAIGRARRRAHAAPDPWPSRLPFWLGAMKADARRIHLAASNDVAVPAASGPWRAAILIPSRLFDEAGDGDIERIGLHEAAHFARRDDWALAAQRLIEAVLWAHPAVRLIGRELDMEREIACDDRVVSATGEARAYAACLTRMMELCGTVRGAAPVPTMADKPSRVSRRIELLLDGRSAAPCSRALLAGSAIALALTVAAFAAAPPLFDLRSPLPAPSIQLVERAAAPLMTFEPIQEKPMKQSRRVTRFAAALATAATIATAEPPQQPAPSQTSGRGAVSYSARRMFVLYFDLSVLDSNQLAAATKAANQFLATRAPSDVTAVMSFDGAAVRVVEDFTSTPSTLQAAMERLSPVAATPVSTSPPSLAGFASVVRMLAPIDGKKAVTYFAPRMPGYSGDDAPLHDVVNAALRANVAFFPIDVSGRN